MSKEPELEAQIKLLQKRIDGLTRENEQLRLEVNRARDGSEDALYALQNERNQLKEALKAMELSKTESLKKAGELKEQFELSLLVPLEAVEDLIHSIAIVRKPKDE